MNRTSLIIGAIFGLVVGVILGGYARGGESPCNAVTQAYTLAHNHYRSRTNLDSSGLYESEIAGIDLANDVAESFNVICEVYP